jgi:hypothetical protein
MRVELEEGKTPGGPSEGDEGGRGEGREEGEGKAKS